MRAHIEQLEARARLLEPEPDRRAEWLQTVEKYAEDFLQRIERLPAYNHRPDRGRGLLEVPIGEQAIPLDALLAILKKEVDSTGINPASGGHLGYIPGGGVFPTALGDFLAAVTNRYAGIFFGNPGAVRMEHHLLRWMCRLVGYPETALGNLASGGSIANLIAIVTARDAKEVLPREVERSVVYLTPQVHHCIHKALRIAGLGQALVRQVPLDERFRMRPEALRQMVEEDRAAGLNPFLVVASAGTTDTGAIDPLNAIADVSEQHGLWFHIDAAYGGFFILTDHIQDPQGVTLRDKFRGIERSDSLVIDPHKGLFLSYGVGAVLIKDLRAQMKSHFYRANYMQDTFDVNEELNPADLSPELTKHFRGLRMWLPLQLFGIEPFKACLEEKIWLCRYFYEEVQKLGFEVGPYPELSVAIYRFVPPEGDANEFNRRLVEWIQCDGRIFISSTSINGTVWLRAAILSFRTHLQQVDTLLQMLREGVGALLGAGAAL